MLKLPSGNAICYSGYREGQSPDARSYPSLDEILQDLLAKKTPEEAKATRGKAEEHAKLRAAEEAAELDGEWR